MVATDIKPRGYQLEGITFLQTRKHAMITDAPGLGKTIQGALAAEAPTLVVAPNYLVNHWDEWLNAHVGKYGDNLIPNEEEEYAYADWYKRGRYFLKDPNNISVARGSWSEKYNAIQADTDWLVINVQMLRTHFDALQARHFERPFQTVIFDESHHLRSRKSQQARKAAELTKDFKNIYMLTASPVWKEVDDLWMQLHILHPDIFSSYWDFLQTFCVVDQTSFGPKVLGPRKANIEELEELLSQVSLSRSYEKAGREVPPLIEKYIKLDFPEKYKKLYRDTRNYWVGEIEVQLASAMEVMHSLRGITAYQGKVDAVVDTVLDSVGSTVTFTWYVDIALEIAKALRAKGLDAIALAGDIPARERPKLAKQHRHIVATLASLSEGVDLSHAGTVIFAEEHYTPGSTYQAMARVRRERQEGSALSNDEPVVVYYVHVRDTIDETIHRVNKMRNTTVKDVIGDALGL